MSTRRRSSSVAMIVRAAGWRKRGTASEIVGRAPGCLFEPAEKTAKALGVVRAGVIGERGVSVARACAAGAPVVGRSLHVVSAELGGQFVAAVPQERAERGRRVGIAGLRCQPLLSGLGDGRG